MFYNINGESVKYFRELKKISQRELAKKVGVTGAYISQIEKNQPKSISDEVVEKISKILAVPIDNLTDNSLVENKELIELLIQLTIRNKIKWTLDDYLIDNADMYFTNLLKEHGVTNAKYMSAYSDDFFNYSHIQHHLLIYEKDKNEYYLLTFNRQDLPPKDVVYNIVSNSFSSDSYIKKILKILKDEILKSIADKKTLPIDKHIALLQDLLNNKED